MGKPCTKRNLGMSRFLKDRLSRQHCLQLRTTLQRTGYRSWKIVRNPHHRNCKSRHLSNLCSLLDRPCEKRSLRLRSFLRHRPHNQLIHLPRTGWQRTKCRSWKTGRNLSCRKCNSLLRYTISIRSGKLYRQKNRVLRRFQRHRQRK